MMFQVSKSVESIFDGGITVHTVSGEMPRYADAHFNARDCAERHATRIYGHARNVRRDDNGYVFDTTNGSIVHYYVSEA